MTAQGECLRASADGEAGRTSPTKRVSFDLPAAAFEESVEWYDRLRSCPVQHAPAVEIDRWTRNNASHWSESAVDPGCCKWRLTLTHLKQAFVSWRYLFGFIHVIVCVECAVASFLCHKLNIRFETPWSLASFALVFPMVFSINNSMNRREQALIRFANVRSGLLEFFLTIREATEETMHKIAVQPRCMQREVSEALDNDSDGARLRPPTSEALKPLTHDELMSHIRVNVYELMDLIFIFIKSPCSHNTVQIGAIYAQIGQLFRVLEVVRPAIETGLLSRVQQYLYHAHTAFEQMRVYKEYGTPYSMRTLMYLTILAFPIIFAPYFALLAQSLEETLASEAWVGEATAASKAGFTFGFCLSLSLGLVVVSVLASLLCVVDNLELVYEPIGSYTGDHIAVALPLKQTKAAMLLKGECVDAAISSKRIGDTNDYWALRRGATSSGADLVKPLGFVNRGTVYFEE
eukprot:TRINITY_DN14292_c0_g1_i1.p1 TRINITY_DN14292_c0_g1~~TRINITY_DN14292_c0_g1_i1.p1  ORF type:complete len:462 (+),score=38.15 TRINITY_DN14292_c0_g1_i1:158-1543(+)